jgi:ABC-type Zn2+ transport system substrate-binding protein/surface adhesin
MKKYTIRMIALLVFASVAVSSCSMEYRQHRKEQRGHDHDHDHDNDHNGHYNRY